MRQVRSTARIRRGAIAPLSAILSVVLLGMMAFAIDMGYIVMARGELQNAADAAALAGVEQLAPYYVQYYSPSATQATVLSNGQSEATLFAKNYASFHRAGNTSSVVLDTTNDLQFGYQDSSTPYQSPPPAGYFPNTVQVTLRLNGAATNAQLNLFFGPVLGMSQATVTVTARATIYNGDVANFSGAEPNLLPATLDQVIWKNFVATGAGSLQPDFNFSAPTSTSPSNLPAPAVSNAPQIQVVPDPNGLPGGWNYLSLDSSSNSNSDLKGWFSSGLRQSDLTALQSGGQLPLPAQPRDPTQATYYWKGIPGNRGNSEPFPPVGSIRLLPLYLHVPPSQSGAGTYIASDKSSGTWDGQSGRGQNTWFNIVQFVAVVITDNSSGLSVQPAGFVDPNAVLTNLQPAGPPPSGTPVKTVFSAPKLTY